MFDHFKFIRYTDFRDFGRLPRSSDGLVQRFEPDAFGEGKDNSEFTIFFSYRWINQDKALNTPDDADRTQYRRMLNAIDLFLKQHEWVDVEKLCIWMVSELRNVTVDAGGFLL